MGFWWKTRTERDFWVDLDQEENNIEITVCCMLWGGMGWLPVTQDSTQ
jgi:hypothetical protein